MAKKNKKTEALKDVQEDVRESAHKIWLAGLGAMSMAEEEGSKLFRNLVEKGKTWEGKGREAVDDVKGDVEDAVDRAKGRAENVWDRVEERLDDAVGGALGRIGVPSRDEIATLTRRVEELTRVVESLKTQPVPVVKPTVKTPAAKPPVKKAPARKTATKKAATKTAATKTAAAKTATKTAAAKTATKTAAAKSGD